MAFDLYDIVKDAKTIGITGHTKPDGDCIGSGLAVYLYLRKRLPDAKIEIFLEAPEPAFDHIPYREVINSKFPGRKAFDAFIVCDTNAERTGEAKKYFDKAKITVNIDHHISNANGTGMYCHVRPEAAATGEILCDLLPKEYLDSDIAALLYMAIAHDTGVFRFSNTTAKVMRAAAALIEYPFDHAKLLDDTFFSCTMIQNRLVAKVLLGSRFYLDNRVIVGSVSLDELRELGATKSDTGVVVERLRNTEHVQCAVFIYEKSENLWKASLRSSVDHINVAKVGEVWGGGGHMRAAGCDFSGAMEEFEKAMIAEIGKQAKTGSGE